MKSLFKLVHKLAKLRSLPLSDQWLIAKVLGVLIVCKGLLIVFPFSSFIQLPQRAIIPRKELSESFLNKQLWAVKLVSAQLPLVFTCLVQALGTKWLLKNHSNVHIHIGVQNNKTEGFSAHAWLTYQHTIILGELPDQLFEPIIAWN